MPRIFNVPLRVAVASGTNACKASLLMRDILQIPEVLFIFPTNTSNLFMYRLFEDSQPNLPPVGLPGGIELTADVVDAGEYIGDGSIYSVPFAYTPKNNPICIKLYAQNDSPFDLVGEVVLSLVV